MEGGIAHSRGDKQHVKVETGEQARLPVKFVLPADLKRAGYEISLNSKYNTGEVQADTFVIDVMPLPVKPKLNHPLGLYDPDGKTKKVLENLGVTFIDVKANAKPSARALLILGNNALTIDCPSRSGRGSDRLESHRLRAEHQRAAEPARIPHGGIWTPQSLPAVPKPPSAGRRQRPELVELVRGIVRGHVRLTLLYYTPSWKYCSEQISNWAGLTVNRPWRGSTYGAVRSIFMERPIVVTFCRCLKAVSACNTRR